MTIMMQSSSSQSADNGAEKTQGYFLTLTSHLFQGLEAAGYVAFWPQTRLSYRNLYYSSSSAIYSPMWQIKVNIPPASFPITAVLLFALPSATAVRYAFAIKIVNRILFGTR